MKNKHFYITETCTFVYHTPDIYLTYLIRVNQRRFLNFTIRQRSLTNRIHNLPELLLCSPWLGVLPGLSWKQHDCIKVLQVTRSHTSNGASFMFFFPPSASLWKTEWETATFHFAVSLPRFDPSLKSFPPASPRVRLSVTKLPFRGSLSAADP